MCVYPPQATEVTPSLTKGQHLRVAISRVARLWREATLPVLPFSNLAPLWLERDWVGGVVVVVGALIGRVSQCFQKRRVLAASLNMMQKMPAANESQQCLSHWTTTLKGIMQLRHHKHFKIVSQQIISVYFFHIIADIF